MKTPVKEILHEELTALGFERGGEFWYKHFDEVIQVVGLQKSNWADQYYINLAVWIKQLGKNDFPKPRECHLQCRLGVITEKATELDGALDEEDYWKMDAEQRREIIKLAVCNAEFVFFRELEALEQVKLFLRGNPDANFAVAQTLKAIV
jgi:hypothetical protein